MVNVVRKGKAFELYIAKKLTQQTGVKWNRTPNSGGIKHSVMWKADLFTEDPAFADIDIECKVVKDFYFSEIYNERGNLWRWIRKCEQTMVNWVLLIKRNYGGIYAISPYPDTLDRLKFSFQNEAVIFKINLRYVVVMLK